MAGSLNHIVNEDGSFNMDLIENMRDAHEALAECHQIIAELFMDVKHPTRKLNDLLKRLSYPSVHHFPIIQPELHGAASEYK